MASLSCSDVSLVNSNKNLLAGYLAWAAVSLFFFYQYILRVAPGVMINEFRIDFHINAEQFSYFGALYLYAYSLLQMPVGVIVDRIGVKRTVLYSIAICLIGTALLAIATNLYLAYFSRLLLGAGSACAFMSTLKIVADYLPAGRRGFLMGATLTLGIIGALVAGKPLSIGMDILGWRHALLATGGIGIIVFLLVFFMVPQCKLVTSTQELHSEKKGLFLAIYEIISNRPILIYATLAVGLYTPLSVMADLWGVAYIMSKYNICRTDASEISMMMYVGLCIGSLLLPWLSEKYNILNETLKVCSWGILITFVAILTLPSLEMWQLSSLLLSLGIFCGAEMLCFTGVVIYAPQGKVGTTLGITNTVNMLGGAMAQQIIGLIMDRLLWSGAMEPNGNRLYTSHDYTLALSSLVVVILLCCFVTQYLPKTARSSNVIPA